ncbi:hypothetical protein AN958_05234 [Leucoagaricus sp. SymC.cos]|nr:hypothetical protein AN958_05234 [Leucoagaricus sp. SymC.cos]
MGRWTQFDEDSARLPEGMKRVGYDADTRQYTFLESSTGMLYESAPGNEYGILRPIGRSANDQQKARPSAFAPADSADNETKLSVDLSVKSFEDFLPPAAITSPPSPKKFNLSPTSDSSSGPRLPDIFRKVKAMSSTVSRMQVSPAGGSRHSKSPSVLSSPTSRYRDSPSPPPYPSHRHRGYTRLADTRQEEDRKGLLRSKTMSSSASSSSSRSHHGAAVSRSSTRASRASAISTTSTVTPMKTR